MPPLSDTIGGLRFAAIDFESAGAARGETVYVKKLSVSRPDRALVRARAAQAALELALRLAQGKVPAGTEPLARDAQHSAEALDKLNEVFLGH